MWFFWKASKAKRLAEGNTVIIVHDSYALLFIVGVVDLHSSLPRFNRHYDPKCSCCELFLVQFFKWDPFGNFGLQNQIGQYNNYCKIELNILNHH